MFWLLRAVLVIGTIFYFSPVRSPSDEAAIQKTAALAVAQGANNVAADLALGIGQDVARALVRDAVQSAVKTAAAGEGTKAPVTDSASAQAALRGGLSDPVRCIYRCGAGE